MSLVFSKDVILAGLLDIWPGFLCTFNFWWGRPKETFFHQNCQMAGEQCRRVEAVIHVEVLYYQLCVCVYTHI